uniref:Phosphoribulokinase/uridine kinase domain-containing protein n=1 Tax=Zea mays TaxID=4577 RepID=A0A804NUX4_MAIZE
MHDDRLERGSWLGAEASHLLDQHQQEERQQKAWRRGEQDLTPGLVLRRRQQASGDRPGGGLRVRQEHLHAPAHQRLRRRRGAAQGREPGLQHAHQRHHDRDMPRRLPLPGQDRQEGEGRHRARPEGQQLRPHVRAGEGDQARPGGPEAHLQPRHRPPRPAGAYHAAQDLCHRRFDERVRDLLDFSIYLDISDEVKFAWKIQP